MVADVQVLQDSLCGSSKVLLVCNLSPEAASCSETLSSLNFASRAAQVELGQARRVTGSAAASSSGIADAGASAADGGSGSPEATSHRRTTSNSGMTGPGSKAEGVPDRGSSSPSPTKQHSAGTAAAGLRSSMTGTLAGSPGRPSSRLSEKPPAGPGVSSTVGSASPRVSGTMAKPARH